MVTKRIVWSVEQPGGISINIIRHSDDWFIQREWASGEVDEFIEIEPTTFEDFARLFKKLAKQYDKEMDRTLPCNACGTHILWNIHEEELGLCVECSNTYFKNGEK
jgi:hypothetical protein